MMRAGKHIGEEISENTESCLEADTALPVEHTNLPNGYEDSVEDGEMGIETGADSEAPAIPSTKSNISYTLRATALRSRRRMGMISAAALCFMGLASGCALLSNLISKHDEQPQADHRVLSKGQEANGPVVDLPQLKRRRTTDDMVPWPSHCVYGETPLCPAKALFRNPEIIDTVVENVMRVGYNGLLAWRDRDVVNASVIAGFRNISQELDKKAPLAAKELDRIQLSEEQKDAVVVSLRLLSDTRVQGIGFEVAGALREATTRDPAALKMHIKAKLDQRWEEIKRLRQELVPSTCQQLWAASHQWEMTLDPETLRMMQRSDGGDFAKVFVSLRDVFHMGTMSTPGGNTIARSYGILGGVWEQGRALIHIVELVTRLFGKTLNIPTNITSLEGAFDFGDESLSCEFHSHRHSKVNYMKAFFCPLKFGAMGLDALRYTMQYTGSGSRELLVKEKASDRSPLAAWELADRAASPVALTGAATKDEGTAGILPSLVASADAHSASTSLKKLAV